jgi:hypothetical protein
MEIDREVVISYTTRLGVARYGGLSSRRLPSPVRAGRAGCHSDITLFG